MFIDRSIQKNGIEEKKDKQFIDLVAKLTIQVNKQQNRNILCNILPVNCRISTMNGKGDDDGLLTNIYIFPYKGIIILKK